MKTFFTAALAAVLATNVASAGDYKKGSGYKKPPSIPSMYFNLGCGGADGACGGGGLRGVINSAPMIQLSYSNVPGSDDCATTNQVGEMVTGLWSLAGTLMTGTYQVTHVISIDGGSPEDQIMATGAILPLNHPQCTNCCGYFAITGGTRIYSGVTGDQKVCWDECGKLRVDFYLDY